MESPYPFVEGTVCYETAETPELFAASGRAFGRFQRLLQGYPAHTLYETIPAGGAPRSKAARALRK